MYKTNHFGEAILPLSLGSTGDRSVYYQVIIKAASPRATDATFLKLAVSLLIAITTATISSNAMSPRREVGGSGASLSKRQALLSFRPTPKGKKLADPHNKLEIQPCLSGLLSCQTVGDWTKREGPSQCRNSGRPFLPKSCSDW